MAKSQPDTTGYLLRLDDLPQPIVWRELFGNERPVEVEVGSGKGLFLVTAAEANPATNYLGIEIVPKYAIYSAQRVSKRPLQNVRVVLTDARYLFAHCLPTGSVRAVHVYFPDPWWKRRHKKRRVFTGDFARHVQRVLERAGQLHVWTDVEEYFATITRLVAEYTSLIAIATPPERGAEHDMDYLTNFERKMRKSGRHIWRARYRKEG